MRASFLDSGGRTKLVSFAAASVHFGSGSCRVKPPKHRVLCLQKGGLPWKIQTMIADLTEYQKAQEELQLLEQRLARIQQEHSIGSKGFTKAGIRKMIARLHEELGVFEASEEAKESH
jgi:hypothetical protein